MLLEGTNEILTGPETGLFVCLAFISACMNGLRKNTPPAHHECFRHDNLCYLQIRGPQLSGSLQGCRPTGSARVRILA